MCVYYCALEVNSFPKVGIYIVLYYYLKEKVALAWEKNYPELQVLARAPQEIQ